MNKEQFLKIYPQIKKNTIEGYMKAMKEQDTFSIHMYSASILKSILKESEYPHTFELHVLTHTVELLLDEYGIDYRYKENKSKDVQTRLNLEDKK